MSLLARLERSVGPYAIPNLTLYLIGGQAVLFVVGLGNPDLLADMVLIPELVLAGEVWRLVTFVFLPATMSILFLLLELYILYLMGTALEQRWGTFRYNLYLGIGFALTLVAAFAYPSYPTTNYIVLSTVFLAFAFLYPDFELLLFFVLPIKVKWLGLLTWGFYAYQAVRGDWPTRLLVAAGVANFFLFFGKDLWGLVRDAERRRKHKSDWERKNRD